MFGLASTVLFHPVETFTASRDPLGDELAALLPRNIAFLAAQMAAARPRKRSSAVCHRVC